MPMCTLHLLFASFSAIVSVVVDLSLAVQIFSLFPSLRRMFSITQAGRFVFSLQQLWLLFLHLLGRVWFRIYMEIKYARTIRPHILNACNDFYFCLHKTIIFASYHICMIFSINYSLSSFIFVALTTLVCPHSQSVRSFSLPLSLPLYLCLAFAAIFISRTLIASQ